MRAGDYRNPVEIHGKTQTPDGMGGFTEAWAKITNGDDWVKIWTMSGPERMEAMQNDLRLEFEASMRYRSDLTEQHRIYYRGVYYEIMKLVNEGFWDIRWKFFAKAVI
jgi:SPP1 family predicted phage head-tail adaptor